MKLIDPAELSVYLDGELDPVRAREVETALAGESTLRAQFNALANADTAWRAAARSANFQPMVRLPLNPAFFASQPGAAAVVALLVAVRVLPKLTDILAWGFFLHGITLAVIIVWVIRLATSGPVAAPTPGGMNRRHPW